MELIQSAAKSAARARSHIRHKRGRVTAYSPNSKTRFRRQIWKLTGSFVDPEKPKPVFWTITLPGNDTEWWRIDHARAFKALREAMRRRFPGAFGYWCKEFQKRGAIHYQGVIQLTAGDIASLPETGPTRLELVQYRDAKTGEPFELAELIQLHPMQTWLEDTWARILGQPARVEAEEVRDLRTAYLAKESSKTLSKDAQAFYDKHGIEETGRWWGLLNSKAVEEAERWHVQEISSEDAEEWERHRDAYWEEKLERLGKRYGWTGPRRLPRWVPEDKSYL